VKNAAVAIELRDLAGRVRRNLPRRIDPERFHVELDAIARRLLDLSTELCGREPERSERVVIKRRLVRTTAIVKGKRVVVERRRPFAVHT
jgi:hypothetical protein